MKERIRSMRKVHVLNGDSLLHQFPESVDGERLVMRECLIEGPVNGPSLDTFYKDRIAFLKFEYKATEKAYQTGTIEEFEKLAELADGDEINLWFEQDLFCQTNLWFLCAYLILYKKSNPLYLIMPRTFSSYGFGALHSDELRALYDQRKPFLHLKEFAALWEFYRFGKTKDLWELTLNLSNDYSFLKETVQAHLDRIRIKDSLGRPTESLIRIIKDLNTTEFGPVFKEFCSREGIYGYGDTQVKNFYNEIIENSLHKHID